MGENNWGEEQITVWEAQDLAVMAYIKNIDDDAITQGSLSSIRMYVYDSTGEEIGADGGTALTVSSVVFDTPLNDNGWNGGSTGYNFRYIIDGPTFIPDGDKTYTVEIIFTPAVGSPFPLVIEVTTKNLRSN